MSIDWSKIWSDLAIDLEKHDDFQVVDFVVGETTCDGNAEEVTWLL